MLAPCALLFAQAEALRVRNPLILVSEALGFSFDAALKTACIVLKCALFGSAVWYPSH